MRRFGACKLALPLFDRFCHSERMFWKRAFFYVPGGGRIILRLPPDDRFFFGYDRCLPVSAPVQE